MASSSKSTPVTGGSAQNTGHDGKSARIAAEVQNSFALDQAGEFKTVFALIAKKSRFVAFGEIYFELDAILLDFNASAGEFWLGNILDSLDLLDPLIHMDDFVLSPQTLMEEFEDFIQAQINAEAVNLQAEHVVVDLQ